MSPFPADQRKYYRHPIAVPIKFQEIPKKTIGRSSSVDISEGGLCFLANRFIAKDALITVSFPVGQEIFELRGKVAYCNRMTNVDFYRTGVCFEKTPMAFRTKFVEQVQKIKQFRIEESRRGDTISEEEATKRWIEKYADQFPQLF